MKLGSDFRGGSAGGVTIIAEFRPKATKQTARERITLSGGLFLLLKFSVISHYKKVEFCGF